jgi:hypothetical protein
LEQDHISQNETDKSNNDQSKVLDIDLIFNKIAPYISNPEFIKGFLWKHGNETRTELVVSIESNLNQVDPIIRTDLRILLNSL